MPAVKTINDLLVFPVQVGEDGQTLISNQQHLLRRFGQLQVLQLAAGQQVAAGVKGEADRFYFALDGECTLALEDLREHSPSRGATAEVQLAHGQPQGLLAPFGVAVGLQAGQGGVRLLVLSTHSEPHPGDKTLS